MANMKWQTVRDDGICKWRASKINIDTTVKFGAVFAIHFAPTTMAVCCEP